MASAMPSGKQTDDRPHVAFILHMDCRGGTARTGRTCEGWYALRLDSGPGAYGAPLVSASGERSKSALCRAPHCS
jgi:hypothetical protein